MNASCHQFNWTLPRYTIVLAGQRADASVRILKLVKTRRHLQEYLIILLDFVRLEIPLICVIVLKLFITNKTWLSMSNEKIKQNYEFVIAKVRECSVYN